MKTTRRGFVRTAGAGALSSALARPGASAPAPAVLTGDVFDVAVVGAGAFGAWTALHLQRAGRRVVLVDAYGPGNARASSGGQSRVIRAGYGDQETYTRWARRSLEQWTTLLREAGLAQQLQQSGVLWLARGGDPLVTKTLETLGRLGVRHERLSRSDLAARWPQIDLGPVSWGLLEPDGGFLASFHAVQAVVQAAVAGGARYLQEAVEPPAGRGGLAAVEGRGGQRVSAKTFVFATGPWLPKLFPEVLGDRIFPTRQEVFYFGVPAGDARFSSRALPVWVDLAEEVYGVPDFKGRGFKVAPDRHGPPVDPDSLERLASAETAERVRAFVARRFPALAGAPIVAAEVCQYENTSNGDFLIDRHPDLANVWLVGGGSGHGFKHAPAVGEYTAERIADGRPVEPKFGLATKAKIQQRTVF